MSGVFFVSLGSAADGLEGPFDGGSPAGACVGSRAGAVAADAALPAGSCESLGTPESPDHGSLGLGCRLSLLESPESPVDGSLGLGDGLELLGSPEVSVDGSTGLEGEFGDGSGSFC